MGTVIAPDGSPARKLLTLILTVTALQVAGALPQGREILRNGDFSRTKGDRPLHWVTYGNKSLATFKILPAGDEQAGNTLRVQVEETSSRPWSVQLRQGLQDTLKKGETFFFTFDYKVTAGYGFACYWQKERSPWPKYLSLEVTDPADEWATCAVAMRVPALIKPGESSVSFHLASDTGTVNLRNMKVLVFPEGVAPSDLPVTRSPVIGGDEVDRSWRKKAEKRIKSQRMAPMIIRVLKSGFPAPRASISVKQIDRDFLVGTVVPAEFMNQALLQRPEFRDLRRQLAEDGDRLEKFQSFVRERSLFNAVSFEDYLTWRISDLWGYDHFEAVAAPFLKKEMQLLGHTLYAPTFRFAPPHCRQLTADQLQEKLTSFVGNQVERFSGTVDLWSVLHAPLTYTRMYDMIGTDSLVRVFKIAREADAAVRLLYSDDRVLSSPTADHMKETVSIINWLRSEGADVSGILLDAETGDPYLAPTAMEERIDYLHRETGLPIWIRGLQVHAPTEELQAERIEHLMLLFYSHPAVHGVLFANVWDPRPTATKTTLFRPSFRIKPAGQTVRRLLTETWHTETTKKTRGEGTAVIHGFLGSYDITVRSGEKTATRRAELTAQGANIEIDLE